MKAENNLSEICLDNPNQVSDIYKQLSFQIWTWFTFISFLLEAKYCITL